MACRPGQHEAQGPIARKIGAMISPCACGSGRVGVAITAMSERAKSPRLLRPQRWPHVRRGGRSPRSCVLPKRSEGQPKSGRDVCAFPESIQNGEYKWAGGVTRRKRGHRRKSRTKVTSMPDGDGARGGDHHSDAAASALLALGARCNSARSAAGTVQVRLLSRAG